MRDVSDVADEQEKACESNIKILEKMTTEICKIVQKKRETIELYSTKQRTNTQRHGYFNRQNYRKFTKNENGIQNRIRANLH